MFIKWFVRTGLVAVTLVVAGCAATSPLSGFASLPSDAAPNCQNLCAEAGLQMSSIVIMANAVGCVCEPPRPRAAPNAGGAAAAAGVTTIMRMAEERPTIAWKLGH